MNLQVGIPFANLPIKIYIALLKFDFFFFLGFTVQFLVVVDDIDKWELGITIAAIPFTIAVLFAAAFFTRRENITGMVFTIIAYFCGLTWFIFKLFRMYQTGYEDAYKPVRKNLTSFAAIAIILIVLTIANAIVCASNFKKGLKVHISKRKITSEEEKADHMTELPDLKHGNAPQRMTID